MSKKKRKKFPSIEKKSFKILIFQLSWCEQSKGAGLQQLN